MPPNTARSGNAQRFRKHRDEYLTLQIKIGTRLAHGRRDVRMAEPPADRGELDAGLQEVDGGGVPQRMGMDAATLGPGLVIWQVLSQQIPNSEPRKASTVTVAEYHCITWIETKALPSNKIAEGPSCPWPEWTHSELPNFAVSPEHRPYWADQIARGQALLNEPMLPTQTLEIVRERLEEASAVLRSIDPPARGPCHAQKTPR